VLKLPFSAKNKKSQSDQDGQKINKWKNQFRAELERDLQTISWLLLLLQKKLGQNF